MRKCVLITAVLMALNIASCGRVDSRAKQLSRDIKAVYKGSKDSIKKRKDAFINKHLPIYDQYDSNSAANYLRFQDHFGFQAPPDVKGLYTYADLFAIDYQVLIHFKCMRSTIDTIIKFNGLVFSDTANQGLMFLKAPEWWPKEQIEAMKPYKVGQELEFWKYLWYDDKTGNAYYEEFSM